MEQLAKRLIMGAPLLVALLILFRCPCDHLPSCKLPLYYSLILMAIFLAAVENWTGRP
jgi:hypothetical protein